MKVGTRVQPLAPVLGVLAGATAWGLLWYPFRRLAQAGVDGTLATLCAYAVALILAVALMRERRVEYRDPLFLLVAAASGWTNLAYVLATLRGEVMQVLLLFYLAPLWTVVLARVLLGEHAGAVGMLVVLVSLAGAMIMLSGPGLRMPYPATAAEWLGLSSGFAFAVANVLARKAQHLTVRAKTLSVCAGVVAVALIALPFSEAKAGKLAVLDAGAWVMLATVGAVILGTSLAVQYGLARMSAARAIVLFLFELVVAAISSHLLAGERLGAHQWGGGALIVLAALLSGRVSAPKPRPARTEHP
jgi:drug/metabolite transporter (DMT)-like permease